MPWYVMPLDARRAAAFGWLEYALHAARCALRLAAREAREGVVQELLAAALLQVDRARAELGRLGEREP